MDNLKNIFFEQVSRIGKAISNPKRLEIIELLCQGEKSVDTIAKQSHINIKLASSHLQELKYAALVESRKEGKFVFYSISEQSVLLFYTQLKTLAEKLLISNQNILSNYLNSPDNALPIGKKELLKKAKTGEVIVIDVRPKDEYIAGHIPYARSVPVNELEKKLKSLPKDKDIVAYCRGAACVWSHEAIDFLKQKGYKAFRLKEGVADWRASGLPVKE